MSKYKKENIIQAIIIMNDNTTYTREQLDKLTCVELLKIKMDIQRSRKTPKEIVEEDDDEDDEDLSFAKRAGSHF